MNYKGDYWLAGLFDAEGSMSFNDSFRINITQKNSEILEPIQSVYGGAIDPCKNKFGQSWFQYRLGSKKALEMIVNIFYILSFSRKSKLMNIDNYADLNRMYNISMPNYIGYAKPLKDLNWIKWAAGFLEGEGTFEFRERGTPRISAPQNKREVLDWLAIILGGKVSYIPSGKHYYWEIDSNYAIGIMMTLYPLMSSKRKNEIKSAIFKWRSYKNTKTNSPFRSHCKEGHPWITENIYTNNGRNWCKPCRAIISKKSVYKYRDKLKAMGIKRTS